jgi:mannose-6-phosphate isomerase-like protein (cupin superfamily)
MKVQFSLILDWREDLMASTQRRVLNAGEIINDPVHGETVRFLEIGGESAVTRFELTAEPQASGPPAHIHPKSYERFEVVSGAVLLKSGREERIVEAGEAVTVEPRVSHTWHNHTKERAVVLVELDPGYGVAQFLDQWYELARAGRLNSKGDLGLLPSAALFSPHIDLMAVPGIPLGVQRVLIRSLGWLGRRRGYET